MTPFLKLPRFTRTAPTHVHRDHTGMTVLHLRPVVYGMVPADVFVWMDAGTYDLLDAHGYTLFGSRAGHLHVAHPDVPLKSTRLTHLLLAAPSTYERLHRDGDARNLLFRNVGFKTPGGKTWWHTPVEGEADPAFTVEGQTYRYPASITSVRDVVTGKAPSYTPLPPRTAEERLAGFRRRLQAMH